MSGIVSSSEIYAKISWFVTNLSVHDFSSITLHQITVNSFKIKINHMLNRFIRPVTSAISRNTPGQAFSSSATQVDFHELELHERKARAARRVQQASVWDRAMSGATSEKQRRGLRWAQAHRTEPAASNARQLKPVSVVKRERAGAQPNLDAADVNRLRARAAAALAGEPVSATDLSAARAGMSAFAAFERSLHPVKLHASKAPRAGEPMPKPEEPAPGSCCGNDCQNCVWIGMWACRAWRIAVHGYAWLASARTLADDAPQCTGKSSKLGKSRARLCPSRHLYKRFPCLVQSPSRSVDVEDVEYKSPH